MSSEPACVFCALYSGELEASTVFKDESIMAVMIIRPAHVGHVLLFPRTHVEDFALLDQATLGYLFRVAARLKVAISNAVPCEGFQLLINQGEATGQKRNCRHLHLHLIPRSLGIPVDLAGRPAEAPRAELDETAREIASRLNMNASRGAYALASEREEAIAETDLATLRAEIDKVDEELVKVLARRFAATEQVGRLKAALSLSAVDEARELQQQQRLRHLAEQMDWTAK